MAQWKETLEPYIKVNERIRTTTIVPTAGEDLIIGATLISDSGPSYPVLITSQREFLNVFASQDITKGYLESLNDFYDDGTDVKSDVASTMWLNAYRLAGSTNMLIVRATKGADMNYVVPVDSTDTNKYIVRDGQLLKQISGGFCLTQDRIGRGASNKESGWAISVYEIGIIGNLMSDDGPVYEYFAADLRELVEYLNSTSKFFSPKYSFYKWSGTQFKEINDDDDTTKPDMVKFEEVYLAQHFIDKSGFINSIDGDGYGTKSDGLAYLLATKNETDATTAVTPSSNSSTDTIIDLNGESYSGWEGNDDKYFVNTYNSNTDIQIRIRRFNHDAVILRDDIKPTIDKNDPSPYEVIEDVINQFNAIKDPAKKKKIAERDFYEVAVLDLSLDKDPLSFCVGNIPGRGDLTLDELNDTLKMINLHINKMEDLELEYYSPNNNTDDLNINDTWEVIESTSIDNGVWVPVIDQELFNRLYSQGNLIIKPKDEIAALSNYTIEGEQISFKFGDIICSYVTTNQPTGQGPQPAPKPAYVPVTESSHEDENSSTYAVDEEALEETNDVFERPESCEIVNGDDPNNSIQTGSLVVTKDGSTTVNDEANHYISTLPTQEGSNVPRVAMLMAMDIDRDGYSDNICLYQLRKEASEGDGMNQIHRQLGISGTTSLLTVTPDDLMRSISAITEDEVYTTEGLTDLGNTDIKFQTYLCNMAKNENYFYPISTLYSTNYLAIANYRSRLAQDSYKLYTSAPWDIDSGTVGFKFHACPSVIYWEAVSRNRSMNREFASVFGFSGNGQVLYTNPVTEFTKKQRQLLLSKQVNTVMWNTQSQTWNMNDCYTMTSENHILNEDGNSRLFIRINKAIPVLLKSLIGRKLGPATYSDAEDILKYWFERTIVPMQYSVSGYKITISTLEANDDQARRQNKMYVLVECLFPRSLKYVIVYSDALDMGMEFVGEIV